MRGKFLVCKGLKQSIGEPRIFHIFFPNFNPKFQVRGAVFCVCKLHDMYYGLVSLPSQLEYECGEFVYV